MLDRAILHLTVIVESIDTITAYVSGKDEAGFLADRLCDAVTMNFLVIVECARKLTPRERDEAPGIPWTQIVNLRHRIAHDYRNTDFPLVWQIIETEFNDLRAAAVAMLTARGEAP